MSRDRAYSTASSAASSGYGSEDPPSAHSTPNRRNKRNNNRHGRGGGGGHHNNHHPPHRYHDMTLLCHRVDVFDDFVPGGKKAGGNNYSAGLVPIRCLGVDRGCACHTPCMFCHTVIEDYDESPAETATSCPGPPDINPNLAFLFAGNAGAKKAPTCEVKEVEPKTTVSSKLIVDPIFAQNHGLLSDNVEGGVKVKKYHHPPVGRYAFHPPLQELPQFFDEKAHPKQHNGHTDFNGSSHHGTETTAIDGEGDAGGLDSFFDDFALNEKIEAPPPDPSKAKERAKKEKDDSRVLVFRAPLKTVVKKTLSSNGSSKSGKCLCQCRYENLVKGSTQPNPHDQSFCLDKYWAQRRRLFKRFDDGIQLDAEGWYSVTPEVVADHVASRFADASDQLVRNDPTRGGGGGCMGRSPQKKKPPKSMVILDAFCGCGGNAIAFGKLPASVVSLVVCIDVDREKLRMAAHNASIYHIPPNRIIFVEANSIAVMERCYRDGNLIMDPPPRTPEALSAYPPREIYDDFTIGGIDLLPEFATHIDAVFIDPPWGGIDYGAMGKDGYDLARDMKIRGCERGSVGFPPTAEVDGVRLLKIAAAATSTRFVAYDMPRNVNKKSLAHAALEAGYEGNSKLEEHYLNGRLKTVTAYFGQDFRHLLDLRKYHQMT